MFVSRFLQLFFVMRSRGECNGVRKVQECDEFMSSDQSILHVHCAMAFAGPLIDEESTPQFPPLMKSICSLRSLGLHFGC